MELLGDADVRVRAEATRCSAVILRERDRSAPAELVSELRQVGGKDAANEPRLAARFGLLDWGDPLPLENPDGSYQFKVCLRGAEDFSAQIEMTSTDVLHQLHFAILEAFGWTDPHLYTFFFASVDWDDPLQCSHPEVDPAIRHADDVRIGDLGLRPKQSFSFLFDFGDYHRFDVKVTAIQEVITERNGGPIIEVEGVPPDQYPDCWE